MKRSTLKLFAVVGGLAVLLFGGLAALGAWWAMRAGFNSQDGIRGYVTLGIAWVFGYGDPGMNRWPS